MRFVSMTDDGVGSVDVDDSLVVVAHRVGVQPVSGMNQEPFAVAVQMQGHTIGNTDTALSLTIVGPDVAAELAAQLHMAHCTTDPASRLFQNAFSAAVLRRWRR